MAKYGRFDERAREYAITRPDTPTPWINYLMGRNVNAIVSQAAGGLAFYKEPSEGRLTRYRFNGLPVDSPASTSTFRTARPCGTRRSAPPARRSTGTSAGTGSVTPGSIPSGMGFARK